MSFFSELKRRNVIRVATAYVVASWLTIQVIETIFPAFGFGDDAIRMVITVLAIAFVPALVFSWVFELTPGGLAKEVQVDREQSITRFTGKRLDQAIMVLLALAVGYFAVDKFVIDPRRDATLVEKTTKQVRSEALIEDSFSPSIAVLPFVNMSDDASNEYFSDGLSEELLNLLAKIPELKVASRSSAFSFKGKDFKISDVGRDLNVAHVLEGSVRKSGDQIRITAQLIKVEDGFHMWSETWDRTLDNIFDIQDEIAATVVEQLHVTLLGNVPKVEETDPEAYALSLQALHFSNLLTPAGWQQSLSLYEQALAIAPDYSAAWSGLSRNYINLAGYNIVPPEEGYELGREAALKALEINLETATAYAALGWIAMNFDGDLVTAGEHFRRALELDPNNLATIRNAATYAYAIGRLDYALELGQYSVSRDPINPAAYFNLTQHYTLAGRYEEAIEAGQTALRLSPGMPGANYFIGESLLRTGQADKALEYFTRETDDEWRVKGITLALYELGQMTEYKEKFTELREGWEDRWPTEIAHVYAWTGDVDSVFPLLEKEIGVNGLSGVMVDPFFTALHEDPRWLPLLEKAGVSPQQLEQMSFQSPCSTEAAKYGIFSVMKNQTSLYKNYKLKALLALVTALVSGFSSSTLAQPAEKNLDTADSQTVLITGANRGIGLELARQYSTAGWHVIGTARKPKAAETLKSTSAEIYQLDVTSQDSVEQLALDLAGRPIDMLINNAGIQPLMWKLDEIDFDKFEQALSVNTIGPVRVTRALMSNLQAGSLYKIINITTNLSSIAENTDGGFYGYRESKAALNMFTRSLAMEFGPEGFICIVMHPGWVRTDLGGPQAPLNVVESVEGIRNVISKLTPADNGSFWTHDGKNMAW